MFLTIVAALFAFVFLVGVIGAVSSSAHTAAEERRAREEQRRKRVEQYREKHAVRPAIAWSVIAVSTVLIFATVGILTS